jgi:ADP-ribose pyrophosphatase
VKPDAIERIFEGRVISLVVERWGAVEREIVEHPGAVAVVATDGEGRVILVRQVREAVRRDLLEIPAGTLAPREDPFDAARRELAEETGYRGGSWRRGPSFFTAPGFCRERMHLFLAEGVEPGEQSLEEDEGIEVVLVPATDVRATLERVEDAKTLAGLLLYLEDMI